MHVLALLDELPDCFDRIQVCTASKPVDRSDAVHLRLLLGALGLVKRRNVLDEA